MARIDLRELAPPDHSFIAPNGIEYYIPGDPAVETIIEAITLRDQLTEMAAAEDEQGLTKAMDLLQGLVRNMIDDAGHKAADVEYPRLGPAAISHVISLALDGEPGQAPEDVVMDALRASEGEPADGGAEGTGSPPTALNGADSEPPTPPKARATPSRKRSPARSSG